MYTQKQEQKIKTIDLNEFLDGFHNYRTINNEKQSIKSHPFAMKLRNHLNDRAETCFSIQSVHPQSRNSNRSGPHQRYSKEQLHREEDQHDLENINLDSFMHTILTRDQKKENGKIHEFIRSLNGTWFQGTDELYKTAKIVNTLGIKKCRSLMRPRTQRFNPEHLRDRIDFTKQFRQTGLFPSRKTNSHNRKKLVKSPSLNGHHQITSPNKNNEGPLKYQIVKTIKSELEAKSNPRPSTRVPKNNYAMAVGNFNNQKIFSNINKQGIVKGKRMVIHD